MMVYLFFLSRGQSMMLIVHNNAKLVIMSNTKNVHISL